MCKDVPFQPSGGLSIHFISIKIGVAYQQPGEMPQTAISKPRLIVEKSTSIILLDVCVSSTLDRFLILIGVMQTL